MEAGVLSIPKGYNLFDILSGSHGSEEPKKIDIAKNIFNKLDIQFLKILKGQKELMPELIDAIKTTKVSEEDCTYLLTENNKLLQLIDSTSIIITPFVIEDEVAKGLLDELAEIYKISIELKNLLNLYCSIYEADREIAEGNTCTLEELFDEV